MDSDFRLGLISHSSLGTLSSCARKFQLSRLQVQGTSNSVEDKLTFGMGHIAGLAIQICFEQPTISLEDLVWKLFLSPQCTPIDLLESDSKRKKSFYFALHAARIFHAQLFPRISAEYELVYLEGGKPATELSFAIHIKNNIYYRGFIDAVIRHKETGRIAVLENKTSSIGANPALYKNSTQGVGYTIVVDHLFPEDSALECIYFVYDTKQFEYTDLPFPKSSQDRLDFLRTLWLEATYIEMCAESNYFPKRGTGCFSFFKECPFYGVCDIDPAYLVVPADFTLADDLGKYDYHFTFEDCFNRYTQGKEI